MRFRGVLGQAAVLEILLWASCVVDVTLVSHDETCSASNLQVRQRYEYDGSGSVEL